MLRPPMLTVTSGCLPPPSASTISAGTWIPVAVLPALMEADGVGLVVHVPGGAPHRRAGSRSDHAHPAVLDEVAGVAGALGAPVLGQQPADMGV